MLLSESWVLIKSRQGLLLLGLVLIMIGRLAGLVIPASTKYLIDDILGQGNLNLLAPLVLAVLGATLVKGLTAFSLIHLAYPFQSCQSLCKLGSNPCRLEHWPDHNRKKCDELHKIAQGKNSRENLTCTYVHDQGAGNAKQKSLGQVQYRDSRQRLENIAQ